MYCKHCSGPEPASYAANPSTHKLEKHLLTRHQIDMKKYKDKDAETLFTQASAEQLLAEVIAVDCLPLRHIESKAFERFVHHLNPDLYRQSKSGWRAKWQTL